MSTQKSAVRDQKSVRVRKVGRAGPARRSPISKLPASLLETELLRRAIVKTTANIQATEEVLGNLHVKLDHQQAELTRRTQVSGLRFQV